MAGVALPISLYVLDGTSSTLADLCHGHISSSLALHKPLSDT
ncbi:Hypothetical protein SCLAV_1810 [Streptomyces clavuligerus]|uniref:Uncharacterized protein n=1 Tax=Streptomyces clavuligerus TaxID=1901 RepID=B5H2X6_STRCL|nr:hypothetical protein SSCG_05982 [Streptomyces clavuligerus]EFG06884.1 Hypothetical protein SCLAV_1810 [Streptomyces clavuligerus]